MYKTYIKYIKKTLTINHLTKNYNNKTDTIEDKDENILSNNQSLAKNPAENDKLLIIEHEFDDD